MTSEKKEDIEQAEEPAPEPVPEEPAPEPESAPPIEDPVPEPVEEPAPEEPVPEPEKEPEPSTPEPAVPEPVPEEPAPEPEATESEEPAPEPAVAASEPTQPAADEAVPTPSQAESDEDKGEVKEEEVVEEKKEEPVAPPIPNIAPEQDVFDIKADEETSPVVESVEAAKQALPTIKGVREVPDEPEEEVVKEVPEEEIPEKAKESQIFALRTTANREDQVLAFVSSNAARKKLGVYSVIAPHGMRGYIFVEAVDRHDAEQAAYGVPYAKGLLPNEIQYEEIEHMLEQVKKDINIQKNDIAEILSGPFKREKCKIARVDKAKEEVVVELLEAAVPIPITLKIDSVKVIRRDEK